MQNNNDIKKNIGWKTKIFPFKNKVISVNISEKRIFIAIFSGSIICLNLDDFSNDLHLIFNDIIIPIVKFIVFSDSANEIRLISGLKNGKLVYNYIKYNDKKKIIDEKTQLLSIKLLDQEIIEINYNRNSSGLIYSSKNMIYFALISINYNENKIIIEKENLIFQTDEIIFQINYSGQKLLISTYKNYFFLNIFSQNLTKIGTKEKNGFYGACFIYIEENEFAIAGRPNGILWKVEGISGKVLNSYKFLTENDEKLNFGLFYNFDNFLLSFDLKNIYIFDFFTKEIIDNKKIDYDNGFCFICKNSKKKFDSIFLIGFKNNEILIEKGILITIENQFNSYLENKNLENAMNLIISYKNLQNINYINDFFKRFDGDNIGFNVKFNEIVSKIEEENFQKNETINIFDEKKKNISYLKTKNFVKKINVDNSIKIQIKLMEKNKTKIFKEIIENSKNIEELEKNQLFPLKYLFSIDEHYSFLKNDVAKINKLIICTNNKIKNVLDESKKKIFFFFLKKEFESFCKITNCIQIKEFYPLNIIKIADIFMELDYLTIIKFITAKKNLFAFEIFFDFFNLMIFFKSLRLLKNYFNLKFFTWVQNRQLQINFKSFLKIFYSKNFLKNQNSINNIKIYIKIFYPTNIII